MFPVPSLFVPARGLNAFELLVLLQVFLGKVDSELKVAAMHAAEAADAASADAEQALPHRSVIEIEIEVRPVRIKDRSPNERFTAAC